MALALDKLGTVFDERAAVLDAEQVKAYAAATNDDNPVYISAKLAPPVFGVVPTWEAMQQAVVIVPAEALMMVVHGEQDMHFHQPLVPGLAITTRAQAHSVRVGKSGTRYTIKVASTDEAGQPVLDQYVTMFIRGMADGESGGPDKPDHTFPRDARSAKVGEHAVHVDEDQTFRYRDASGDNMPIHVDEDFARSVGLPGIIAHGLCTMAMASQAVVKLVADDDPARVRRLAVRFAGNVFPGEDVVTTVYDAGTTDGCHVYGFESTSRGDRVITHGRAEIAS